MGIRSAFPSANSAYFNYGMKYERRVEAKSRRLVLENVMLDVSV